MANPRGQHSLGQSRSIAGDKVSAERNASRFGASPLVKEPCTLENGMVALKLGGPHFTNGRGELDIHTDGGVVVEASSPRALRFDATKADFSGVVEDASMQIVRNKIAARPMAEHVSGLGTAALLDVAAAGDAATGEVVLGSDTRLTDDRDSTPHTHDWADVTDTPDTLAGYGITDAATQVELDAAAAAAAAALAGHEADTAGVHGITDTAALSLVGHAHAMADVTSGAVTATQHGAQVAGTLHAVAIFNRSGFMHFDDKNKLDLLQLDQADPGAPVFDDTSLATLKASLEAWCDALRGSLLAGHIVA